MAGPHLFGWDLFLGRATRAVYTRTIVALGFTPYELLFGVQPRMPFELAYLDEVVVALRTFSTAHCQAPDIEQWDEVILGRNLELQVMKEEMLARWARSNTKLKGTYDRGVNGWKFQLGDLVMLYDHTVGTKSKGGGKFDIQWPGPYLVEGYAGDHQTSYHLKHIHGERLPRSHYDNHLSLHRPRTGYLSQPFNQEPIIGPKAIRKLRETAQIRKAPTARVVSLTEEVSPQSHATAAELNKLGVRMGRKPQSVGNHEDWVIRGQHAGWVQRFFRMSQKT